jgi:hypothetical protein
VSGVGITAIIVGGLVLIVWLASRVTPVEKRTQHPCYFQGVHVELGDQTITLSHSGLTVPTGRKIGAQPCSGPPEYSYAVQPMHPAHVLTSVKVCPAHVGALQELAAALSDSSGGYWVVPD